MSNLRNDKEAEWPEGVTTEFLNLVYERLKQHPPGQFVFKGSHWTEIGKELRAKTGAEYARDKLTGKYNRCKTIYRLFNDILNHTGVTFDATENRANADEWIWEKYLKLNRRIYGPLKKHGCKHYEMYCIIFPDNIATGGLVHPSSQAPVESDEEREIEDEYISPNIPTRSANTSKGKRNADEMMGSGNTSKGKRSADEMMDSAKRSVNKGWKEHFASAFVSYSDMMSEDFAERRDERKAKQMLRMQRQESASGMSTGGTIDSMSKSVQLLNEFTTLSSELYKRAYKKIVSSVDERIGFIAMTPERRLDWLNDRD